METDDSLKQAWIGLTGSDKSESRIVNVAQNRDFRVNKCRGKVAEMNFKELCEGPRGSTDYMALAHEFHTLIIRKVPQFTMDRRDIIRRFIILIDQFYFNSRKVILEANHSLETLFDLSNSGAAHADQDEGFGGNAVQLDEEFAVDRCLSRLIEMQTEQYHEKMQAHEQDLQMLANKGI